MSGPVLLSCCCVVCLLSAQHTVSWVNYNHPASSGQRVKRPGTSLSVCKCSHANIACWQEAQPSITGICIPVCCELTLTAPHNCQPHTTARSSPNNNFLVKRTAHHQNTHGHLVNSKTLPTISRPVGTCSSDSKKTTHNHQQS